MNARKALAAGHGSAGLPWLTGLLVAIAAGVWMLLGPVPESLVFDRAAIADGEAWRLITGHLVHSDGRHALWDIGALAIIGTLMEGRGRLRMLAVAGIGVLAVNACLWWGLPELDRYCGLSGMLNALFVVVLADLWRQYRHPVFVAAAVVLCVKLIGETSAAQSLLLTTAWPSVPSSHLAGCLGGLVFLAIGTRMRSRKVRSGGD